MKYVKNTTDEPRRVDDGEGRLLRVPPRSVVAVPDDSKTDVAGLEESTQDAYDEYVAQGNPTTDATRDASLQGAITNAETTARQMSVINLQEVVGDSDAPFGPDNGTITTKQLAAAESPEAKRAFADHENIDPDKEGLSETEVYQAEKKRAAEELAQDLLSKASGDLTGAEAGATTGGEAGEVRASRSRRQRSEEQQPAVAE